MFLQASKAECVSLEQLLGAAEARADGNAAAMEQLQEELRTLQVSKNLMEATLHEELLRQVRWRAGRTCFWLQMLNMNSR